MNRLPLTQLQELLAPRADAAARALAPALRDLRARLAPTMADWDRVFPGLVAVIGLQGLLWPAWTAAGGQPSPLPYTRPEAGDVGLWRFDFRPAAPQAAWSLAGGPGLADWAPAHAALTHRDVRNTLASLDAGGKVVVFNSGGRLLAPLVGGVISGETRLGLPCVDCATVNQQLSEWRNAFAALTGTVGPIVADLVTAADAAGADRATALSDGFACFVWPLWAALASELSLTGDATARPGGLRGLFARRGPEPYKGILLLHGDHYALWQELSVDRR